MSNPTASPGAQHQSGYSACPGCRYSGPAREQVAAFAVQIMAQNGAAAARLVVRSNRLCSREPIWRTQNGMTCISPRAGRRNGVFVKTAFHLNQPPAPAVGSRPARVAS